MSKLNAIERLIKEYKLNKARIIFLEGQINKISTGEHFYLKEYSIFYGSCFSSLPMASISNDGTNGGNSTVNELETGYSTGENRAYSSLIPELGEELKRLKHMTGLVEDALDILEGLDKKQKNILESYYICGERMEDIAFRLHISRSRCYELCKEALEVLENVIYGRYLGCGLREKEHPDQISLFDIMRQKLTYTE